MMRIPVFRILIRRLSYGLHTSSSTNIENMSGQTKSSSHPNVPSYKEVLEARERIAPYIHRTPVLTNSYLNQLTGRNLYFKCENFQKTGSFKARGAVNSVLKLKDREPDCKGVVCHSSGNHGIALAYAASIAGVPCTVISPNIAAQNKRAAVRGYGAHLEFCEPTYKARLAAAGEKVEKYGMTQVNAHEYREVIAGQGSIGVELLEQVPELDAIVVTVSGGGMAAGIGLTVNNVKPGCKVFIAEPEGKELGKSLKASRPLWTSHSGYLKTIADGCRLEALGDPNFEMFMKYVEKDVFTVNDAQICEAMRIVWERMKLVIEPSAAVPVAALLSEQAKKLDPSIKNIGVVLCGGNVDVDDLPWMNNIGKQ